MYGALRYSYMIFMITCKQQSRTKEEIYLTTTVIPCVVCTFESNVKNVRAIILVPRHTWACLQAGGDDYGTVTRISNVIGYVLVVQICFTRIISWRTVFGMMMTVPDNLSDR